MMGSLKHRGEGLSLCLALLAEILFYAKLKQCDQFFFTFPEHTETQKVVSWLKKTFKFQMNFQLKPSLKIYVAMPACAGHN